MFVKNAIYGQGFDKGLGSKTTQALGKKLENQQTTPQNLQHS